MEDKATAYKQIVYQREWDDELGYMTNALDWFERNKKEGVSFYGARWSGRTAETFCMQMIKITPHAEEEPTINLMFADGNSVTMTNDTITVYEGSSKKVIKRYLRFLVNGELEWRLNKEIKEVTYRNYDLVPSTLNMFVTQFLQVIREMYKMVPDLSEDERSGYSNRYRALLLNRSTETLGRLQQWNTTPGHAAVYNDLYETYQRVLEWHQGDRFVKTIRVLRLEDVNLAVVKLIDRLLPLIPKRTRSMINIQLDANDPNPINTVTQILDQQRAEGNLGPVV